MTATPASGDEGAAALELAEQLFAAIATGDLDALRDRIYAPDVVVWHNNDDREQNLEENLKLLGWLSRKVTNQRYENVTRQATENGFVAQHVLIGTAPNGNELRIPSCLVVTVTGDRISRIDEYIDSAALAPMAG